MKRYCIFCNIYAHIPTHILSSIACVSGRQRFTAFLVACYVTNAALMPTVLIEMMSILLQIEQAKLFENILIRVTHFCPHFPAEHLKYVAAFGPD